MEGMLSDAWIDYFNRLALSINSTPNRINRVSLTAQGASISATDYSGATLDAGLYRASYYTRITRAASTSSSLIVTFGWTETSVALTVAGAAITGNSTTTMQSGSALIEVDSASPVTYATTYVSVGGTSMQYRLTTVLEQVRA